MKKLFFILVLLNFLFTEALASENVWKNNARKLFQNNNLVILEINPRTFSAKDLNNNGIIEFELGETSGNFISAVERLDEIKKMGFNAIHVMPVTPVGSHRALGTAGSLYAISEFDNVNPQLDLKENNMTAFEEFKIFVRECHKKNIRVIVDLPSCGAYDLFLVKPELFFLNEKKEPISPADWLDVYLFDTLNKDGTLNEDVYLQYKKFVDLLFEAKVDGIRADVAPLKPYKFWEKLISYAREKDSQFLFLAEASNVWTKPHCKECIFTSHDKLLEAGFDGYYGSYFDFKNWTKVNQLKKQVNYDMDLSKKYSDKKSVIGSFTTHDEQSPVLIGGYNFLAQIIWMNALLPLNPYFVDGNQFGDTFIYEYSGKEAKKTYTDNLYYHVHKGKPDIFNFSRQPKGHFPQARTEIEIAMKFREYAKDVITYGKFSTVKSPNKSVFAFTRKYQNKTILVILNKNKTQREDVTIRYKGMFTKDNFIIIKAHNKPIMQKDKIKAELEPSEILILYSDN